ncbi:MAG: transcriptional repressor [Lachnospiraceae bacterium]|nr:transcriptional repressor [Lachnospiraceae bacterium]
MGIRAKYKTKQQEIILSYLKENKDGHVTIADMCDHIRNMGLSVGQSTVYRQMDYLVEEGLVNKYIIDVNSPACFEYVGDGHEDEQIACIHLKCETCGKLIHLKCSEMQELEHHLFGTHNFKIDPTRTVLYGICEKCQNQKTE